MDVYEITGFQTGVSKAGVNFLQPADAFEEIRNGYIYRQVLQSRQGIGYFAPRLADESRIFGIFEHTLPNGNKELLAIDQNFLYKFNTGTGIFDQIPFAGSMAAYTGFNISAKDLYVSGTTYPTKTNTQRFVFTGEGITANAAGSAIFFYNGTDVRDFTGAVDNPDFANPPGGTLTRAFYVLWFNERLNFIVPTITAVEYNQGVLYSGIRDSSGNGDKFNVAGSGQFNADTYQNITGATILGQILALNFDRMAYTLEKTRDAFNPYFGRAVPGPLGTNAKFSAVTWADKCRSIGRTGILSTDGRQNLRVDDKIPFFTSGTQNLRVGDKIPFFTADEIDQVDFNLTYGGYDRINSQFLWSYKQSETDSDTQNRVLVGNYEENSWSIYDLRLTVFGQTDIGLNLTWDDIDGASGNESWAQWDTTGEIWDRIGLGEAVQKTLAGDDLGFIYQLNQDFDDYFSDISVIAQGATTVLTVTAIGIEAGDSVTVSNVEGMTQINNFDPATNQLLGDPYTVLAATPTSITINVDSTLFDAYTTGGTVQKPLIF
jgi:hypothetical protein